MPLGVMWAEETTVPLLSEENGCMHEIVIKLWRNQPEKDWTLEINGDRHEGVTIERVQELVYCAVLDAEDALISISKNPPQ
jgi:hypothetical protein